MEKNAELEASDPARKFKGRVVFQGNRVVDQNYDAAIFQDLGSTPATMEASKMADFCGCCPSDAVFLSSVSESSCVGNS